MSRDYGEVEREFIDGLEGDTGRDLARWMALIDGQTFAHRNDMIDWLRQQGLTFAKASRLERIHHNGGRALYGDKAAGRVAAEVQAVAPAEIETTTRSPETPASARPPTVSRPLEPPPIATAATMPPAASPTAASRAAPDAAALSALLARAKGYRPLAELVLRVIRETLPGVVVTLHDTHLELGAPQPFAALAVSAKDVRIALDLGDVPFEGDLKRLRLPGVPAHMTHTLVIDDARRVDAELKALLTAAATRVDI